MQLVTITIQNWKKYNPRNDRSISVWFRFQNNFFLDQKLFGCTDQQKLLFLFLLCEASKLNGESVSLNFDYVALFLSGPKSRIMSDLKELESRGIILPTNGTQVVDDGSQLPTNGTATRQDKQDKTNIHSLAVLWNREVRKLSKVKRTDKKRITLCEKNFKNFSEEEWIDIFHRADASHFLTGGGDRGWKASFDWVVKNATRISEGEFTETASGLSGFANV